MNKVKKVKLEDITTNLDKLRIPLSSSERSKLDKIYPYYGAQSIVDYVDRFLFDGEYLLVAEDGENLKSQNSNVCNYVTGKFWVNNHAHILQSKDDNSLKYIYYLLNLRDFRPYVTGSAQPKLTQDNLNKMELLIHEPCDQQKIASVLTALDSKIEFNNRINAELEAMAKTLYDYWFVQFDFPNKNGKPYKTSGGKMVWNEELKRAIPEGWEVKPLSEITAVSNESVNPMDFPDKEFKYYSIPGFDESGTFKNEKGFEIKSNKYSIKSTDVLVSKLNPWFSRVIYATDDSDLISSTEFVVWRTDNLAIKNYMYMIARDASFVTFCTKSASGTSNSHKRVNPTVMMKYKIVFDETIATLFGNTLGSSIKMLAKNKIENQKLTELRDWLLPMLMNGQVKVN